MLDAALTARIAAAKLRLLEGGLLIEVLNGVSSHRREGHDARGRQTYTFSPLDALIEQRPAARLRGAFSHRTGRQHGTDDPSTRLAII